MKPVGFRIKILIKLKGFSAYVENPFYVEETEYFARKNIYVIIPNV